MIQSIPDQRIQVTPCIFFPVGEAVPFRYKLRANIKATCLTFACVYVSSVRVVHSVNVDVFIVGSMCFIYMCAAEYH